MIIMNRWIRASILVCLTKTTASCTKALTKAMQLRIKAQYKQHRQETKIMAHWHSRRASKTKWWPSTNRKIAGLIQELRLHKQMLLVTIIICVIWVTATSPISSILNNLIVIWIRQISKKWNGETFLLTQVRSCQVMEEQAQRQQTTLHWWIILNRSIVVLTTVKLWDGLLITTKCLKTGKPSPTIRRGLDLGATLAASNND